MASSDKRLNTSRRKILLAAGAVAAGAVPAAALLTQGSSARATQLAEPPQYVPVPDHARPPEIPSTGYLLDDLGGGLYGIRNGRTQSMFLVTHTGVVVMDAGRTAEQIMAAIRSVTNRPVTHFVYSHSHIDHVGGASFFGDKVRYVAHELTAERLKRANDPLRPVPTRTFAGNRHVLHVGGQRLILEYHGNIHCEGNIFIFAPDQKTLMSVDTVAPRWAPYFELALNASYVPRYFDAVNKIIPNYDFETLTGAHGGWYGTRADVEEHGRYLADLDTATRQAVEDVNTGVTPVPEVDPDNQWAGSQVFYNAIADRAAELMPTSWLTRLGGADVFLRENTHAMGYSVVLDSLRAGG